MTYKPNSEEIRRIIQGTVSELKKTGTGDLERASIKARGGVDGYVKHAVERILAGDVYAAAREMDAGLATDEGDKLPFPGQLALALPRFVKIYGQTSAPSYKTRSAATPVEVRADANHRLQRGKTITRIAESHRDSLNKLEQATGARPDELMGDIEKRYLALPAGADDAVA